MPEAFLTCESFFAKLARVREAIGVACGRAGRAESSVRLLPVTKTHPAAAVEYVHRAGLEAVGENRVQEALAKRGEVAQLPVRWELIGHLQSNKARDAARVFERIQSVDSAKLLHRLDRAAAEAGRTLAVLLQVNAGDDPAKYGVPAAESGELLEAALQCENLQVDGLMTIAPLDRDASVARRCFARLRETRDRLQASSGHPLPELSMGMSGDLAEAIAEGTTQVRIGTALFGARE